MKKLFFLFAAAIPLSISAHVALAAVQFETGIKLDPVIIDDEIG